MARLHFQAHELTVGEGVVVVVAPSPSLADSTVRGTVARSLLPYSRHGILGTETEMAPAHE